MGKSTTAKSEIRVKSTASSAAKSTASSAAKGTAKSRTGLTRAVLAVTVVCLLSSALSAAFLWTGGPGVGPLVIDRFLHRATLLTDGTVLVTGGLSGVTLGGAAATAEVYTAATPATGAFTPSTGAGTPGVGLMIGARFNHVAQRLLDGTVLVAGGDDFTGGGAISGSVPSPVEIENGVTSC